MKLTLNDYNVHSTYKVHWGDMDAAQHVNNLVYLRWAESARVDYFAKMDMDISFNQSEAGPILGWQECKYIFPVTFPDQVVIGTRTIEVKADRFIIECGIFTEKHQRIAAITKQSIIPYNYRTLQKVAMPEEWIAKIKNLENKSI